MTTSIAETLPPRVEPFQSLRRLTPRRVGRKLLRLIRGDYVRHRGFVFPSRELRRQMCGDQFGCDEYWFQSAVVEALRLRTRLGYTETSTVVDIGCGLGRLAIGMLWEFREARYLGIDASRPFTAWCRKYIERGHPSFRFLHIDVVNERYNPKGTVDGGQIRLPVPNAHADIAYLYSVFTNMGPDHVQTYVSEVSRLLRPWGRAFLTAFVEDDVPDVSVNPRGYGVWKHDGPLTVVRYSERFLSSLFSRHGLVVDEFRYHGGSFPYQSEIYLRKASTG